MKLFEMIIKDGENAYVITRPAKDLKHLKSMYSGNGEFVRIKDVTEEWKDRLLLSADGIDTMQRTLKLAGYEQMERDIIVSLLQMF